jgi:allantoicase
MDGWETRRRRVPGNDACIVKLALPGVIKLIDLDTRYFTGNYPPKASVEATNDADPTAANTTWTPILPASALGGDRHNPFPISAAGAWSALRLNIFPDGGIARFRVYGVVKPDWNQVRADEVIDLFAIEPGRGVNMGDGWETRRRREPGFDWVIVRLGQPGIIEEVEVDTAHFRGNFPDRVSLQAAMAQRRASDASEAESAKWPTLLAEQPLRADSQHRFKAELASLGPVSHVRMNIHPDGGVSRLRLLGRIARS